MATTVRKQAPRLARPVGRYWKGKAPKGAADLPSGESDEEEEEVPQEEGDVAFAGEQEFSRAEYDDEEEEEAEEEKGTRGHRTGKMSVALKNVNISKEGKVIVAGRQEVDTTEGEGTFCNLIVINDYENYLEISEETGEESDAKASSRDETDDVCQPPSYIRSLNGYRSQANPNLNRKRKNLRFNSGLCSFQSKSFSSRRSYPCSPYIVFVPLRFIFTDEVVLRWLRGRH
jgi:hypothetical protein